MSPARIWAVSAFVVALFLSWPTFASSPNAPKTSLDGGVCGSISFHSKHATLSNPTAARNQHFLSLQEGLIMLNVSNFDSCVQTMQMSLFASQLERKAPSIEERARTPAAQGQMLKWLTRPCEELMKLKELLQHAINVPPQDDQLRTMSPGASPQAAGLSQLAPVIHTAITMTDSCCSGKMQLAAQGLKRCVVPTIKSNAKVLGALADVFPQQLHSYANGTLLKSLAGIIELQESLIQVNTFFDGLLQSNQNTNAQLKAKLFNEAMGSICHGLFPPKEGYAGGETSLASTLPLMYHFLNVSKVPAIQLLLYVAQLHRPAGHVAKCNKSSMASSAERQEAGLCLKFNCIFPLVATNNSAHWDNDAQRTIRNFHSSFQTAFPDATLAYNGNIFPCGLGCVTVGFTSAEQRHLRLVVSVLAIGLSFLAAFSVVVLAFNRKSFETMLVRRLMFATGICGALSMSMFVPAFLKSTDRVVCHDDQTLRIKGPSTSSACALQAFIFIFFATMALGYFAALGHAWYMLVKQVEKPRPFGVTRTAGHFAYKYDIIYGGIAFALSVIRTGILFGLEGIDGVPLYGLCMESVMRGYLFSLTAYYACAASLIVIFLALGLHELYRVRSKILRTIMARYSTSEMEMAKHCSRDVGSEADCGTDRNTPTLKENEKSVKEKRTRSFTGNIRKRHHKRKAEDRRTRQLYYVSMQLMFVLFVVLANAINAIVHAIQAHYDKEEVSKSLKKYFLCMMTSCHPAHCPSLPSLEIASYFSLPVVALLTGYVMCSWCLAPSLLANVPIVGLISRKLLGKDTGSISQSSRPRTSDSMALANQRGAPPLISTNDLPDANKYLSPRDGITPYSNQLSWEAEKLLIGPSVTPTSSIESCISTNTTMSDAKMNITNTVNDNSSNSSHAINQGNPNPTNLPTEAEK